MTELSLHGIDTSRKAETVTHVSGTKRHLSLRLGEYGTKAYLKSQLLLFISTRLNTADVVVCVPLPQIGAVFLKRLHRGEDRGQAADDRQTGRLAVS